MEETISSIIGECEGLNPNARTREAVLRNYDIMYRSLVAAGVVWIVAHTRTMMELGRLHGRSKIERILGEASFA